MAVRHVFLDSTPLALLVKRKGASDGDACRVWLLRHTSLGVRFYVPEIVVYELRRELLRIGSSASLAALDMFVGAEPDRLRPLGSPALRLAAELWANIRRQGRPTAGAAALDIDVILAAQALTSGWDPSEFIVATSNRKHVGIFVPAADWTDI